MSESTSNPISDGLAALIGRSSEAPKTIEVGAGNTLQAAQKVEVEIKAVKLAHEVGTSGVHRLRLQTNDAVCYSDWASYDKITKVTDPESGVVYCAVTDEYAGILPRVFRVEPMEAELIRS